MNIHSPFTLPDVEFVGGATQELMFHCYHKINRKPSDLSPYTANFSVISYVNKYGSPLISKPMNILQGTDTEDGICNILTVVLDPSDTKDLRGKYIYQIKNFKVKYVIKQQKAFGYPKAFCVAHA